MSKQSTETRIVNMTETTRPYRVLHGITGAAGQANALAKGLRAYGIEAENLLIGDSRYGYKADHHVPATHRGLSEFLIEYIDRFDIFHLHFRPIFYEDSQRLRFPSFADFPVLKAAGKRIVFHFRGSEIRSNADFARFSSYNYVEENAGRIATKFPDDTKQRVLQLVRAGADAVLANDFEIASYVGEPCEIINRLLDEEPAASKHSRGFVARPLVVHAPSRRGVKGTPWVIEAVQQLFDEGLEFDFKLVENMTHKEAMETYAQADIVIDQLRIGWYGVLSVEVMSMGKPILCYIREDLQHHLGAETPMQLTNRETLAQDLKTLIENPALRDRLGARAYAFFREQHSREAVLPKLVEIYDRVWNAEPHFDPTAFLKLIPEQFDDRLYNKVILKNANTNTYKADLVPDRILGKVAYLWVTQGFRAVVKRTAERLLGRF